MSQKVKLVLNHEEQPSDKSDNSEEEEIFFKLIQKVGSMGRYQISLFFTLSAISMFAGGILLMTPFLFFQDAYVCTDYHSAKNCLDFVCGKSLEARKPYLPTVNTITSFANKFGDYRCPDEQATLDLIKTIFYAGYMVGNLLSAAVGDLVRSKFLMVGGMIICMTGILVATLSQNIWLGTGGLFLITGSIIVPFNMTYIFITEMVEQKRRQNFKIVVASIFSAGALTNVLWFYLIPDFQKVSLFFFGVPLLICTIIFMVFFKDTPISLITKNKPQRAYKHLMDIAKMNGIQNPDLTVEEIKDFQDQYRKNFSKKSSLKTKSFTIFDLFRFKSLRRTTIMVIILDIVFALQYFTPTLMLNQFKFNIYVSGASIQSAQIFSGILGYLIIKKVPRRKQGCVSFFIIMLCSIVLIFIWDQDKSEVEDAGSNLLVLFFIFIILLTVSNAFNIYAVYLNELYPTQVRIIGVGFIKTWGSLTAMVASQIINACINGGFKIMILFAVLAAISIVLCYLLPETHGQRPPQVIQELLPPNFGQENYKQSQKC